MKRTVVQLMGWLATGMIPIAVCFLVAYWRYETFFAVILFVIGTMISILGYSKKTNLFSCFITTLIASLLFLGVMFHFHHSPEYWWANKVVIAYVLVIVGIFLLMFMTLIRWNFNEGIDTTRQIHHLALQNYSELRDIKSYLERMDEKSAKRDYLVGEDFIVHLTIEGTECEDVEVKIEDLCRSIRLLVNNIIREFELPMMDAGGNPLSYFLGKIYEGEDDPVIFEKEDEDGNELCLLDYDVASGDHLVLICSVLSGQ